MEKIKKNHALRVSVVGGGCSGMSYNLSFDNNKGEFDKVFEIKGVKVYCDLKSWLYVKGTTIDFSDDLLSGGLKLKILMLSEHVVVAQAFQFSN